MLGKGVAIAEDVQEAGAGLAVAPEPAPIAEAIARILGNETLRHEMGRRAREFAEREYSTYAMAERLIALYKDIRTSGARCAA